MSLWNNLDGATGNSKPKYANTSSVFGVSATEAANTLGDGPKTTHSGWVQQTIGTGSLSSLTITAPGGGYTAGFLAISGGGGTGANGSFTVDGNGNVATVVINAVGSGYTSAPTVIVPGSNTAIATVVATVGGRAGRRFYETLVATGSIRGDDVNDDTYFPGT